MNSQKPKIAVLTTTVLQVKFFLVPHLVGLSKHYDVTLILKNDFPEILDSLNLPVKLHFVPIERQVSPINDLVTLFALFKYFRIEKFRLVHTVNPKAGLLGIVAAWAARVPRRVHTFQGEIWANKTGVWRQVLRGMDWVVGNLASHLTVVSESERQILIKERLIPESRSVVLANGSIGGVNLDKFSASAELKAQQRQALEFLPNHVVFVYLGRLTEDKGLLELRDAFDLLAAEHEHARLLLVGPDEGNIQPKYQASMAKYPGRIRFLPYTNVPHETLQVADVLMLPSHREGFGVVIIEAAALGIPAIASRIYGISDAMVENQTGLMFSVGNVYELHAAMNRLLQSAELRSQLGHQAMVRVKAKFNQVDVVDAFVQYYEMLLGKQT